VAWCGCVKAANFPCFPTFWPGRDDWITRTVLDMYLTGEIFEVRNGVAGKESKEDSYPIQQTPALSTRDLIKLLHDSLTSHSESYRTWKHSKEQEDFTYPRKKYASSKDLNGLIDVICNCNCLRDGPGQSCDFYVFANESQPNRGIFIRRMNPHRAIIVGSAIIVDNFEPASISSPLFRSSPQGATLIIAAAHALSR
jgi:hypothetical protein